MGLSNGGSMEQKLQGSFMLFDKDHNGQLERDEVITCFQTLLHSSLYKRYVETHDGKKPKDLALTDAQKTEITTVVGALFDALDADKVCPCLLHFPLAHLKLARKLTLSSFFVCLQNGTIDMEEFVNGFKTHPDLCQPLMQF